MIFNRIKPNRRAVALIITLLLVMLIATTVAQLTTSISVAGLEFRRRSHDIAHRLAVDSALRYLAQLVKASTFQDELDYRGEYIVDLELGMCHIQCRVSDDGAKFDPNAFVDPGDEKPLRRKLRDLASVHGLTRNDIRLQPIPKSERAEGLPFFSLDQLLRNLSPEDLRQWQNEGATFLEVGSTDDRPIIWSDIVTCHGEGHVDLRRVSEPILEVLLRDIDPAAAGKLIRARRQGRRSRNNAKVDLFAEVDADVRQAVAGRVGWDFHRYDVDVYTTCGSDRRRWHVVATIQEGQVQVHHRSRVQW